MNSQTTEKALSIPLRTRKGRRTLIVALLASAGAAALLLAESMSPSHLGNATPRINASTVGQGLGALAAFAWIAFVWMCTKIRNALDVLLRIMISVVLLVVAAYFLFFAMLEMFMVGLDYRAAVVPLVSDHLFDPVEVHLRLLVRPLLRFAPDQLPGGFYKR